VHTLPSNPMLSMPSALPHPSICMHSHAILCNAMRSRKCLHQAELEGQCQTCSIRAGGVCMNAIPAGHCGHAPFLDPPAHHTLALVRSSLVCFQVHTTHAGEHAHISGLFSCGAHATLPGRGASNCREPLLHHTGCYPIHADLHICLSGSNAPCRPHTVYNSNVHHDVIGLHLTGCHATCDMRGTRSARQQWMDAGSHTGAQPVHTATVRDAGSGNQAALRGRYGRASDAALAALDCRSTHAA
jgi:hypothetical protein